MSSKISQNVLSNMSSLLKNKDFVSTFSEKKMVKNASADESKCVCDASCICIGDKCKCNGKCEESCKGCEKRCIAEETVRLLLSSSLELSEIGKPKAAVKLLRMAHEIAEESEIIDDDDLKQLDKKLTEQEKDIDQDRREGEFEKKITYFETDGDGGEVECVEYLPCHYAICGNCRGTGKHDHPAFGNGISGEEWDRDWDDEEREHYLGGAYDVNCDECGGTGKVKEIEEDSLTPEQKIAYQKYCEDQKDLAQMRATEREERRMGA